MSGRLIVDSKAIVDRMSGRQFGCTIILGARLSVGVQPMSGSLFMRFKAVFRALLMCV
jgi:hypothetical protein